MLSSARRCAVLGDPVAHSLSPALHRAGYEAVGLPWEYDAHRVGAGGLANFVAGLDETWRGLSLTMPLKREALAVATSLSERARLAGAANTLVLSADGIAGDNTDTPGAAAALRERYDGPLASATVLGGGATATSTALALCDLGARSIRLLVRSPDRAAETVTAVAAHPGGPQVTVGSFADDVATGEVLVSTIPAEAQLSDLLVRCADVPVVFEVLYHPWPTPLANSALDSGRTLVSGLDLLVHQAALQFSLFTGLAAPLEAMRAAGEGAFREDRTGGLA